VLHAGGQRGAPTPAALPLPGKMTTGLPPPATMPVHPATFGESTGSTSGIFSSLQTSGSRFLKVKQSPFPSQAVTSAAAAGAAATDSPNATNAIPVIVAFRRARPDLVLKLFMRTSSEHAGNTQATSVCLVEIVILVVIVTGGPAVFVKLDQ
jgi:hypothetical protein